MSPPPRLFAFLRAINVGGHTVTMERLRQLFAELGLAEVETFIASGNVVFAPPADDAATLERRIERHLRQALGYDVATFIRTGAELTAITGGQPFLAVDQGGNNALQVGLLPAPPAPAAVERLLALRTPVDDLRVDGRELYWLRRRALGESALSGGQFERALGAPTTLRSITTMRRLAARYL